MGIYNKVKQLFASDADIKPILMNDEAWGSSRIYSGTTFPEYNPDALIGRKGYQIYNKMLLDEQVKAVTQFRLNSVTGRKFFFKFPKQSTLSPEEAGRRIDVFNHIVSRLPGTFKSTVDGIMSAMPMGFSLTEKVYEDIEIDGKAYIGIKSLKTKPASTFNPYFDEYNNLVKLTQSVDGAEKTLDISNFIHHVNNPNVHAFFGQSEIREAYRAYFSKDITIRFHNMWLERMAAGFVWAQPDKDKALIPGTPDHNSLTKVLRSIRNHTSLIMPSGVDLNVVHPTDTQAFERAIAMQDKAIAKALLVPNLLGLSEQGSTGSFAQSKTQLEAFLWDLDAATAYLESTLNAQLFTELGDINFGDGDYPQLMYRKLSMEQTKDIITTWRELVSANVVTSTDEDENLIRNYLDIPERKMVDQDDDIAAPTAPTTALNGAQVTSMILITETVAGGRLPKEVAINILIAAYPLDRKRAEEIINPIIIKDTSNEQGDQGTTRQTNQSRQSGDSQRDQNRPDEGQQAGGQGRPQKGDQAANRVGRGQFTRQESHTRGSYQVDGNQHTQSPNQCRHDDYNGVGTGPTIDGHDRHQSGHGPANGGRVNFARHTALRRVQFAAMDRSANLASTTYTAILGDVLADMTHKIIEAEVETFDFEAPNMDRVRKVKADTGNKRELNVEITKMLKESFESGKDHAKMEIDRAKRETKYTPDGPMTRVNFAHIEIEAAKFYRAQAYEIAGGMSDKVESIVRNEIMNGIQYTKSQQEVSQAIYDRIMAEGLIPSHEVPVAYFNEGMQNIAPLYRLENTIRTSTFNAINEGRQQFFEDPSLEGFVVAYQYSAIIDGGTTAICNELGNPDAPFIRLVDDPIWLIYRPGNHYQCRAILIALVEGDEFVISEDDPVNFPQEGFS